MDTVQAKSKELLTRAATRGFFFSMAAAELPSPVVQGPLPIRAKRSRERERRAARAAAVRLYQRRMQIPQIR
jgi:hypothetical protein